MSTTMKMGQIKRAMKAAGIEGELSGKGGADWSVELADEATMEKFQKEVCQVGGFKTGYGAWVLSPSYVSKGDPGDPSSRWHY